MGATREKFDQPSRNKFRQPSWSQQFTALEVNIVILWVLLVLLQWSFLPYKISQCPIQRQPRKNIIDRKTHITRNSRYIRHRNTNRSKTMHGNLHYKVSPPGEYLTDVGRRLTGGRRRCQVGTTQWGQSRKRLSRFAQPSLGLRLAILTWRKADKALEGVPTTPSPGCQRVRETFLSACRESTPVCTGVQEIYT